MFLVLLQSVGTSQQWGFVLDKTPFIVGHFKIQVIAPTTRKSSSEVAAKNTPGASLISTT